jgi:hypothetical protein
MDWLRQGRVSPSKNSVHSKSFIADFYVSLQFDYVNNSDSSQHMQYKSTYWDPLELNQTSLKYLNLNQVGGIIDEPFTNRLRFWDSLKL